MTIHDYWLKRGDDETLRKTYEVRRKGFESTFGEVLKVIFIAIVFLATWNGLLDLNTSELLHF